MARRSKPAPQTAGSNREDEDYLNWAEKIEEQEASLETLKGRYMNECRTYRESIKRIRKACKAEGGSVAQLNYLLKRRHYDRKLSAKLGDMAPDDARAAIILSDKYRIQADLFTSEDEAAERRDRDLDFMAGNTAAADVAADNAARLTDGIQPLNS